MSNYKRFLLKLNELIAHKNTLLNVSYLPKNYKEKIEN